MPIVHTHKWAQGPNAGENLQVYNGFDCCITIEVFEALQRQWNKFPDIYDFERALQGPYLEIMQRGFRIDSVGRAEAARRLRRRIDHLQARLNQLAMAVWDKPLNPASPKQLKDFFYKALRMPEVWLSQKGERKLSTNREALEKLEVYMHARPFTNLILASRDFLKQLQVFEVEIDADHRFRTSYNIAGTETGRASSSENAFGTGSNLQNIAPSLRHVFVADEGYKLVNIDLEQVEARDVGFICGCLFGDWGFLDACESGDLHTANAVRIWPERAWTGDIRADRKLANEIFYRDFSYRDMAKRGSHLSNYMGTAYTAARHLKVPQSMMEDFQHRYCRGPKAAFPAIAQYWQWVASELQTKQVLFNLFGRQRHFFGRPNDDTTLREAIAFVPQSTTADRCNLGLYRIWKHQPDCKLLAQTHDSVTFQARDDARLDDLIAEALRLVEVTLVSATGRQYTVPGEAQVGWNWGKQSATNPDGLVKWAPGQDKRSRTALLQRRMPE